MLPSADRVVNGEPRGLIALRFGTDWPLNTLHLEKYGPEALGPEAAGEPIRPKTA